MMVIQKEVRLPAFKRGFHLITHLVEEAIPELRQVKAGIAQVFIMHTSASLTLNENADPTVRTDFESHFNVMVPEGQPYYQHTYEGPDDMPAHIKAALLGSSVSLPVKNGRFHVGTWQGLYLCEHRDHGGCRRLTISIMGE
ncbi:MAG: secondary thiamine-phosphate synthase enzyme YjbQ [Lentisphaeria bacterium]|nr:secondary thiamine-phosphate synthase enzyme YjbQ [Lentisphaeria bacterium]